MEFKLPSKLKIEYDLNAVMKSPGNLSNIVYLEIDEIKYQKNKILTSLMVMGGVFPFSTDDMRLFEVGAKGIPRIQTSKGIYGLAKSSFLRIRPRGKFLKEFFNYFVK